MCVRLESWSCGDCLIVEDITKEKFYFIDVQTLCKTDQGQYLPVEIALAEFSLEDGITNLYQEFLRPGDIPIGMRYTCQQNSKSTRFRYLSFIPPPPVSSASFSTSSAPSFSTSSSSAPSFSTLYLFPPSV